MKSRLDQYLESIHDDNLDKRFLVVLVVKDYDDEYQNPIASFDTEEEAEKFVDNEYRYQSFSNLDQYRIIDQGV